MGLFIFGLIFALVGVVAIGVGFFSRDLRLGAGISAFVAFLVAVAMIFGSMFHSIGAREVGVQVNQGQLETPLPSGWHLTAPWVNVVTCPLTEEYSTQNADPKSGDAQYDQSVPVAGSDGGSATADVTVAYHIDEKDVDIVYRNSACDLTRIKDNYVAQRVRSDVAQAAVKFVSTDLRANRSAIEKQALALLQAELGPQGITIDSATIADMQLSAQAQTAADNKVAATNALGVSQINLQKAQIDKQTALVDAQAEKAANSAKSQSLTQAVLCEQWIQAIGQNQHLTVLSTSGPCSATAASSTSVLVPAG